MALARRPRVSNRFAKSFVPALGLTVAICPDFDALPLLLVPYRTLANLCCLLLGLYHQEKATDAAKARWLDHKRPRPDVRDNSLHSHAPCAS